MKKIAKAFAVFVAIALLGTAVSCNSSDDGSDPWAKGGPTPTPSPTPGPSGGVPKDALVFNVTADGGTAEDTVLFVKYDRSAKGADELVSISNAEFNIWKNDSLIKTYTTIEFALDEYGDSFSGTTVKPITDPADMKEYKVKLPIGGTVKKGDVIKVKLAKGTITGPGKAVVKPENILVALIDITAPAYYKEIADKEYQPLGSAADSESGLSGTVEEVSAFATEAIGDKVTFNVTTASIGTKNTITLRYLRSAKSAAEAITLKDAVYYVQYNDGKIYKAKGDIAFELNKYGACFEEGFVEGKPITDAMRTASGKYKAGSTELSDPATDASEYTSKISYAKQLKVGDKVTFQLVSAKVAGEGKAKINDIKKLVKAVLVDEDEDAGKASGMSPGGYYQELCAQLVTGVYPRVIKDDATIEAVEETPTPTGKTIDVAVNHYDGADHGIQYTEAVATCIPAGAKSGDVYTLKMVGTADAEFTANLLFVNGSWAGITGEAIPVTFTTTEFTIEKDFTFSADTDADCKFMLTNAEMSPAVAKKLTLKEYSFTKKGATPTPTPTGSYKAYTLTTNKAVKKDDVGLTFQYFVGAGETPVTVDITNLKVSLKVGDAAAVEKTFDSVKIEHHSWDANAAESNARVNLSLGSADEEIASGTTVVLQVLAATLSDATKADGITFALQQDGKHNEYDMLTAADSHPFAK